MATLTAVDMVGWRELCRDLGHCDTVVKYHWKLGRIPAPIKVGGRLFVTRAEAREIEQYMANLPASKRRAEAKARRREEVE